MNTKKSMNMKHITEKQHQIAAALAQSLSARFEDTYAVTQNGARVTVSAKDGPGSPASVYCEEEVYRLRLEGHTFPYHHAEDLIPAIAFWMEGNLASVRIVPEAAEEFRSLLPIGPHEDPHKWAAASLSSLLADHRGITGDLLDGAEYHLRTLHPRMWVDGVIHSSGQSPRLFTEQFDYEAQMKLPFSEAIAPLLGYLEQKGLTVHLDESASILTAHGALPHQMLAIADDPRRRLRFDLQFDSCPLACYGTVADLRHAISHLLSGETMTLRSYRDGKLYMLERVETRTLSSLENVPAWIHRANAVYDCHSRPAADQAADPIPPACLAGAVEFKLVAWPEEKCGKIAFEPAENAFGLRPVLHREEDEA